MACTMCIISQDRFMDLALSVFPPYDPGIRLGLCGRFGMLEVFRGL